MAIVTVLGAGMMGSALCVPLLDRGHEIRLVGTHLDDAIIDSLRRSGHHPTLKYELPTGIAPYPFTELDDALEGAAAVALGVSSPGIPWSAQVLGPWLQRHVEAGTLGADFVLFSIAKGLEFEPGGLVTLPDAFHAALPPAVAERLQPVAVAGPCIAGELARRVETAVVLTSRDRQASERCAELLRGAYYHVFIDDDLVGVEACAALKNAYAMGIAFATGAHLAAGGQPGSVARHNAESAAFAQSVFEMARIVELLGGNPKSAYGLPGVGDLDVTTNGGRTGRFGAFLGQGMGRTRAIEAMQGATLECLYILEAMRKALEAWERHGLLRPGELPLLRHMAAVALDDAPVRLPIEAFFGAATQGSARDA
jgi:glycerol-3-phosphate dehydrogenase (NAD(P)+)